MQASHDFSQLDNIACALFVLAVRPCGRPEYAAINAYALAIANRPLSDFVGRTALDIYAKAFGRAAYDRHCQVIAGGTPLTYELDLPFNGITRLIRTTLTPQRDANGKVSLLYGHSVDISKERKFREAQVSFDTLTTEMEQFVAMAAHDLRAPMRNVALLAGMLREDIVDHGDGKLELLDMMEEVSTKSMALISDVLTHAHATAPKDPYTTFQLHALCRDVFSVLDPHGKHQLNVKEMEMEADKIAVQTAIRNVCENAIKHGQRNRLRLEIIAENSAYNMLNISVSDNGGGFAKPTLAFLNGGSLKVDSGYGLFGVRRMLNARGGRIKANNARDGGGVIRFSLPGRCLQNSNNNDHLAI